eukprot:s998_g6.t1
MVNLVVDLVVDLVMLRMVFLMILVVLLGLMRDVLLGMLRVMILVVLLGMLLGLMLDGLLGMLRVMLLGMLRIMLLVRMLVKTLVIAMEASSSQADRVGRWRAKLTGQSRPSIARERNGRQQTRGQSNAGKGSCPAPLGRRLCFLHGTLSSGHDPCCQVCCTQETRRIASAKRSAEPSSSN